MTDSNPGALVFTLFNEIGIIDQLATSRFARVLAPELTPSEFSVLNHFVRLPGEKSPTRLAKAFQMTKPSMTAILGKLERKAYVEIRASETDRRRKIVTITDAGKAARARGIAAMAPLAGIVLDQMEISQLEKILPTLQALRELLDAERNAVDGLT